MGAEIVCVAFYASLELMIVQNLHIVGIAIMPSKTMALHVPRHPYCRNYSRAPCNLQRTAIRLGRYFKTTPRFWLNLQTAYDLEIIEDEALAQIEREVRAGV